MAMTCDILNNRLLLIDDDPGLRRVVKKMAEGMGFEVVDTEDPRFFIKTVRGWHPGVVILDLMMPGADGIQLLRELAADKCNALVVLASGFDGKVLQTASQLGQERGLRMGGTLSKPIAIDDFRALFASHAPVTGEALSRELATAIGADQLFLEYQPKLDCRLGRITGVEALVRWRHPVHGVIPPDQFIALAEGSDLIHRLTDWVVATAARQAAIWHAEQLPLHMAVNISAKDLEDLDLPDRLADHCRAAGINPAVMTLELTETGAMREAVQMMDVLTRLRIKGFNLSIDDFGTGYSSLVQLQKMPFSEIKIDRAFVMKMMQDESCAAIVDIILHLARRLRLKSVAEGVEDGSALDSLINMGCDEAQGYYLSRPLAADRIAEFVRGYAGAFLKPAA
jgi:EAL domain-containing protein (putative c-di-GMP-specific phosphodiesterase class I)